MSQTLGEYMQKKNNDIVRMMNEEYSRHLKGLLNELKPYTSTGIITIGPDLKVVEKRSGLEYTVVKVDGQPGNMKITLRIPEEPRKSAIDPTVIHPDFAGNQQQPGSHFVGSETTFESDEEEVDGGKDFGAAAYPSTSLDNPNGIDVGSSEVEFVVDEKEFTKYYEEA
jgi:hypothetical protein